MSTPRFIRQVQTHMIPRQTDLAPALQKAIDVSPVDLFDPAELRRRAEAIVAGIVPQMPVVQPLPIAVLRSLR